MSFTMHIITQKLITSKTTGHAHIARLPGLNRVFVLILKHFIGPQHCTQ